MVKYQDACATMFMEHQEMHDGVCNVYKGRNRVQEYGFVHRTHAEARANDDKWLLYRVVVKLKVPSQ